MPWQFSDIELNVIQLETRRNSAMIKAFVLEMLLLKRVTKNLLVYLSVPNKLLFTDSMPQFKLCDEYAAVECFKSATYNFVISLKFKQHL